MGGRVPRARQNHADILEDRGDRRMRLVHGDLDGADTREGRKDRVGHRARRALQELVIGILERRDGGCHHIGIGHCVRQVIAARGFRQIGAQLEIDDKTLADLGLVIHHAMAGVDDEALDEDGVGHCFSSIAAATRSACTVSATSWARMILAPLRAAITCAAIEPPRRCCGSEGVTVEMKRLREAPTRMGRPNERNSPRRPSAIMLCSGVLPKPMPGSSTIFSRAMPALAAMSSERPKKSAMSCMMSSAGSALSRLCMTTTGTLRAATRPAMLPSRCRPQTSLAMTAPQSSAQATTSAFMLSMETGTPSATTSLSTGSRRRSSSFTVTGCEPP